MCRILERVKMLGCLITAMMVGLTGLAGEVTVTDVTARQRYPWNGKVDITVTLTGASNDVANAACRFVATNSATLAALNVSHVTGEGVASGSGSTWTRKFVWDATADLGEVKIADVALTVEVEDFSQGVQLWENGPYWAECNVGATKPEEYGYYFWWGDTVGYVHDGSKWVAVDGSSSNFIFYNWGDNENPVIATVWKDGATLKSEGWIGEDGNLTAAHDAATAHLGAPWRMPTDAEFSALVNNCDTEWTTRNGVYGRLVTGRGAYASRSIFLPAVGSGYDSYLIDLGSLGYYWSSSPYSGSSGRAWGLNFHSGYFYRGYYGRDYGQSVRPVRGFAKFGASTTHLALDTRTGTRYAHAEESIAFSTDWGEGATWLVLSVDGVNVLTATTATNGVYVWKPDPSTIRDMMLKLTLRGTVNEALTATFTIASYVYVDAAQGNDAWDGTSSEQAVKTLARAYELAEAGDVIVVAAGTYAPVTAEGKAVTFRGADGATVDGGGASRCVTADDDVVFENFILQNGYDAAAGGGAYGGTFERCTIRDCVSEWNGGGAYEATLRNCVIVGNTAENGWGGGAYGGTLVGCVVKDNVAGDMGGGVFKPESLLDTTFSGNSPEDMPDDGGTVKAGGSFVFVPSGSTTIQVIPHDWFLVTGLAQVGDATAGLDAKLAATYANGHTGWESYVAGLNPNDPASELTALVELREGEVCVSWTPDLNSNGVTRIYTIFGRTDLEKGDWGTPVQPWHRFFKVAVALPTGAAGEKTAVAGEGFVPEDEPQLGGVQLWENGPYWAECNVGATKPEEYGYYFWWGDTVGYVRDGSKWVAVDGSSSNFSFYNWDNENPVIATMWKDGATLKSEGWIGEDGNLTAAHDAATAHLGAPWRMPTDAEFSALISNCDISWATRNGVYGLLVTGRGAYSSRSIFLPAAGYGRDSSLYRLGSLGYYWSSTPRSGDSLDAWGLDFFSGDFSRDYTSRSNGQSVRPLRGFAY